MTTLRDWFHRMKGRRGPLKVWAFCPLDQFPFLLSGELVEQLDDGRVRVKGYAGMVFWPVYLASGAAGKRLDRELRQLAEEGR